jgi:LysM repeat protein
LNTPMQPQWEKKSRFLAQLLIWSGALNIGLLSSLIYLVLRDRPETIAFDLKPASSVQVSQTTNQDILHQLSTLSWGELVDQLDTMDLVEEGYRKRDLALATLVAFHGLDIERALQGSLVQKRGISLTRKEGPEEINLVLYPGLTEDQFGALRRFIQTEKFPFTPMGLFYEIQNSSPRDPALLEAFYLTPEFGSVATLCQRMGIHLPKEFLIEMMAQGDWKTLVQFTAQQKEVMDLSPDRLKKLLLNYVRCRSVLAAKILLQWDRDFILKRFDDRELIVFLDLFKESSQPLSELLKELITSSRSDAVWKKAAEKLYAFAQLSLPEPYDHQLTLAAFAGVTFTKTAPSSISQPPVEEPSHIERRHTIAHGENLWKIARKYKVSVEALRQANHLETDKLREGKTLIIPIKEPDQSRPSSSDSKGGTGRSA